MSSSEIQVVQQQQSPPTGAGAMLNGAHVKRKRSELGPERMCKLRDMGFLGLPHCIIGNGFNLRPSSFFNFPFLARLVSPTSMEGDELDEGETHAKNAQGLDGGRDLEDMDEDHRERMALKRHASTGNLRVQPRVAAVR